MGTNFNEFESCKNYALTFGMKSLSSFLYDIGYLFIEKTIFSTKSGAINIIIRMSEKRLLILIYEMKVPLNNKHLNTFSPSHIVT